MRGETSHYVGGKIKKNPRLVVQSVDEQQCLVKTIHDTAHLERDKTLSLLTEHWLLLSRYVQTSVCTCKYT